MSALSLLERLRGAINNSCNSNSNNDNINNSFPRIRNAVNRESGVYIKTSDSKLDTCNSEAVNNFVSTVAEREQWERVVCAFTNKTHDLVDLYKKMMTNTQEECSFITIMQRGLEFIEMSMYNSRRSTSYSVGLPFCLRNDISSVLITLHHLMENVSSTSSSSSEAYQHEHESESDSVNNNNILRTNTPHYDKYTARDVFYTVWNYIAQELIGKQTPRIGFDLPVNSDNEVKEEKGKKGKKRSKKTKKNASSIDEKESKVTTDEAHNTTLQITPIKVPHLDEFKVIVSKIVNLPIIAEESTKEECALEDKHTEEEEGKDKGKKQKTVLKYEEKAKENTKMSEVEQLSSHIKEDAHAAFTPLLMCSKENEVELLKKFRADDINNDIDDADDVNTDDEGDNEIDMKGNNNKIKSKTRLRSGRHVYNYELYHQSFSVEEALNEKVLSLHEMVEHLTTQGIMLKRRVIDVVRSASLTKNSTKMKMEQEWESHESSPPEKRHAEEYKMGLESNTQTSFQSVSWALASSSPTIVAQTRVLYNLHLHNMIVLLENFTLSELVAEPKSAMLFGTLRTFKEKFPQLFTTEGVHHYNQDQQQQETITNHLQRLWQLLTSKFREEYILPNQKLFVESYQELSLCKDVSILEKRNVSKSKRRREKLKR